MEIPSVGDLLAVARTGVVRTVPPSVLAAVFGSLARGPGIDVLLAMHAAERPTAPALLTAERVVTWRDLRDRVVHLAGWMADRGLDRDGRLAVVMGNRPGFVEAAAAGAL